jgi:type III secretion protein N (ATPase)
LTIKVGDGILGRVLSGLGEPIDGKPLPPGLVDWSVDRDAPDPFTRRRIEKPLPIGLRCIDGLLTVGDGQRVGLFAGSGVGKSTLMGQIARQVQSELSVIALIGERGREVREFIEDSLGEEGLRRSVVVCATSDQPALVRLRAAFVATAIAEYFRDRGGNVMFMLDTVTRLARAQREIGLAVGEPPARQGYPPSVFSMLPRLLERTGNSDKGNCTAIYTVLVAGSDMDDPIADEVRGILDGHFILNRALGERNQWPAMDVLPSLSRVMSGIVTPDHKKAGQKLRETLATYEKQRDLILLGAYQYGTDPRTDYAIDKYDAIVEFLKQETDENCPFEETVSRLSGLFAES